MKLINKIFLGATALTVMGAFSSCKEEATLGGADAVYIEMANTNMTLLVGDTIKLDARVSNVSGKTIETPIEWSVGDENVAKIVDIVEYKKVKDPNAVPSQPSTNPGSPDDNGDNNEGETGDGNEGEDNGEDSADQSAQSRAADGYKIVEIHYAGITAVEGAQGKSTSVKATIENGQFAMTNVTVGRNSLSGAITLAQDEMRSYIEHPNDTVWFNVNPIQLVDDYELSYEFKKTEVVAEGDDESELEFTFPDKPLVIDREGGRVGVVYTAPRISGKAECTLKLSLTDENGEETESATCKAPIYVFYQISGGLEYESNGETIRPVYEEESPSNIKPKYTTVTMDVNSTHLVGVCLGIRSGREDDIRLAMAAEKAGYFKWEVEGSALVVEDIFFDEDYVSGYVTYIKVRSGVRSGSARCTFTMPTFEQFICDITVEDYNVVHPVNDIVVTDVYDNPVEGTYETTLGQPMSLNIFTDPDASFTYHIPEVTSSDPSILEVVERDPASGYARSFNAKKPGNVTLTIKSMEVVKTVNVTVNDAIQRVVWDSSYPVPTKMIVGTENDVQIGYYMYSDMNKMLTSYDGTVTWTSSNTSVLTVTADPTNPLKAVVKAVGEGEATITASIEGFSVSTVVATEKMQGVTYSNDMANTDGFNFIVDEEYGANTIEIMFKDHTEYFDLPYNADFAGTFTGNDGVITLNEASIFEGATYNITITDNGNGTVTINGTFEVNGTLYTFDNLVCNM